MIDVSDEVRLKQDQKRPEDEARAEHSRLSMMFEEAPAMIALL